MNEKMSIAEDVKVLAKKYGIEFIDSINESINTQKVYTNEEEFDKDYPNNISFEMFDKIMTEGYD